MVVLLGSVLLASVLGSLHCVGMCGPIAALATVRSDRVHLPQLDRPRASSSLRAALVYSLGRLVTYAMLGALAGTIGMAIDLGGAQLGLQRTATWLAGGSMVLVGLLGLGRAWARWARPRPATRAGAGRLGRLARAFGRFGPRGRAFWLGAATTLIPCGWLHAFTLTAAGTGSPAAGVAVMASLWLGTVPALTLLGASIHRLSPRLRVHLPWVMPAAVLAVGVFTLVLRGPKLDAEPGPQVHSHAPSSSSTPAATEPSVPREAAPCH